MRARLLALLLVAAGGCTTGSTGAADAGPDAEISDAFPFPCGDMQCAPAQMCVLAVAGAADAGSPPPPACAELPDICGGAPTCTCLQAACRKITGAVCRSGFEVGLIYCWR